MSLLLQLIQQYIGKNNRQVYRSNSSPANKPELTTSARLSFQETYDNLFWGLQAVQQYTHEDHNPDRIKHRASQKIISPIIRSQNQLKSKVFQNLSQSTAEFQKLWRELCRSSKNHKGQAFRHEPHFNMKVAFWLKRGLRVPGSMETSDAGLSKPAFSVSLNNPASNAGPKNPVSHLKCEFE